MRGVPNRHPGGELPGRKPICQQARARRKAHALKPAVGHPDQSQRYDRGIEAEQHVYQRRGAQAKGHECPGIRAIAKKAVSEF